MNQPEKFIFVPIAFVTGLIALSVAWAIMSRPHESDVDRIRCEDHQKGILIGPHCLKRDAVIWRYDGPGRDDVTMPGKDGTLWQGSDPETKSNKLP